MFCQVLRLDSIIYSFQIYICHKHICVSFIDTFLLTVEIMLFSAPDFLPYKSFASLRVKTFGF